MLSLDQLRREFLASAPDRVTLHTVQLRKNRMFGGTFDPTLLCFADFIRLRVQSERTLASVEADLRMFTPLSEELSRLAQDTDSWPSLPQDHLKLLVFERILRYGFANSSVWFDVVREIHSLAQLYRQFVRRCSEQERMILLSDVFVVLKSDDAEPNALMAFMFHDPSVAVISTASLHFACLHPVTDDPMAGPKASLHLAAEYADDDEVMRVGIWQGVLLLGDRRVLPLLHGCWRSLSDDGRSLLSQAWSGTITAALVSFWLRWLNDVGEDEYGYAAGALAQLPTELSGTLVEDIERRFPLPFLSSSNDYESNPAITVLEQWAIEEFGRLIEPNLRLLLVEETNDRVIPRVLDAWGLDVGPLEEDRQFSRALSAYMKRFDRLRDSVQDAPRSSEEARSPEDRAKRFIAEMLRDHSAGTALSRCEEVADKMPAFAGTRLRNALALEAGLRRDEAMADAEQFRLQGAAMRRLLTRHFGADLEIEGLIVTMIEGRDHGYLFEPWRPR